MKPQLRNPITAAGLCVLLALAGCAGMSPREKGTLVGAGVGAAAGSIISGGSAAATVGGAVVGGVIGNQVKK